MTGKIITDSLQRPNGDTFTFPMVVGTGGPLSVDATGQMLFAPPVVQTKRRHSTLIDLHNADVAYVDVLWDDLLTGLDLSNLAFVEMKAVGISASLAVGRVKFKGLSAPGVTIDTGYMGGTHSTKYGSSSSRADGIVHNSNQGWFQFVNYTDMAQTGHAYGNGNAKFDAILCPHAGDAPGHVSCHFNGSYHQNGNYLAPNTETSAWASYGNNAGPASFAAGIRMYTTGSASVFNRGTLEVTAVLKVEA